MEIIKISIEELEKVIAEAKANNSKSINLYKASHAFEEVTVFSDRGKTLSSLNSGK